MRKADYFNPHVQANSVLNVSGCVHFTGEDHEENNRVKSQIEEHKEFLLKQIKENKEKKALEKNVDLVFDQQRIAVNDQVNRNQREFEQRN